MDVKHMKKAAEMDSLELLRIQLPSRAPAAPAIVAPIRYNNNNNNNNNSSDNHNNTMIVKHRAHTSLYRDRYRLDDYVVQTKRCVLRYGVDVLLRRALLFKFGTSKALYARETKVCNGWRWM
jgi:hypothetical protein